MAMPKECKYCNWESNGDIRNDRKSLIFSDAKIPVEKTISEGNFNISTKARVEITADVLICSSPKAGTTLGLFVWDELSGKEYLCAKQTKINYCPICGRKLETKKYWEKMIF